MKLHPGSLKLAGLYLGVLMVISLFFSATLYQTSLRELDRGLRRPTAAINNPVGPGFSERIRRQIIDERALQYEEARDRILNNLVVINIVILIGGGALCYYLALRTLKPIEESHEAQSRFTADASHELRTPITAMRTENEVALMDTKLSLKDAKAQLQSNIDELDKLTRLSEGLLRLAQIENNHLLKLPVSAKQIVHDAIDRVSSAASKQSISITQDIQTSAHVLADSASLTEALVTLLDNAIKYSPKKSEVHVTVSQVSRQVVFQVTDKGAGIKASELPYIFDRFYRADSSRTKQQVSGYGLGLAIAKSIVIAHNGKLTASSTPDKGSTFTISLPAA